MSDWKYIIFQLGEQSLPVIFPGQLVHADVAKALAAPGMRPISAGHISALQVIGVGGKSETMQMHSTPTDERAINMQPYEQGRGGMPGMEKLAALRFGQLLMESFDDE